MQGPKEPPESLARGTFSKGLPRNLGEPAHAGDAVMRPGICRQGKPKMEELREEASHEPIVPTKVGNCCWNAQDPLEGRGEQHITSFEGNIATLRCRGTMSTEIERLSKLARQNRALKFLSIAHLLTPGALYVAFASLRKDASAGVDGITYGEYEKNVEENIQRLHERIRDKSYSAKPLRRIYIPKEDGKQRAISIPSLEDKIIQRAAVTLLNAIYEVDFYSCSFGFRPGRSQHDALDELYKRLTRGSIQWILEADIQGYFDAIVRKELMKMIERRVKDGSILRLIGKWINIGAIDEGRLLTSETGVGQGQVISPLLANIYLHYVLDEWFQLEVKPRLCRKADLIRFADDFLLCFQSRSDAMRVQAVLGKRFAKFGLTLHPKKTRLIEFGKTALERSERAVGARPATFDFLGFTHIAKRSRRGNFTVHVRTMNKRFRRSFHELREWCRTHRHDELSEQQKALNAKLNGHYQYYGRPSNLVALRRFYRLTRRTWKTMLSRRKRGKPLNWDRFAHILDRFPLVAPRITHAWTSGEMR